MSEAAHLWNVRVYYEDTDAAGLVYYANYLKFMERGRTEFLRTLGFSQHEIADRLGIRFAVVKSDVRFHKPARLDEQLLVLTAIRRCRRASVDFFQQVLREEDEALLVQAEVRVAAVDAEGKPCALPAEVRAALERHLPYPEGEE